MSHPVRTVEFAACIVRVFDGWLETTFREDGSVSVFHPPHEDPEFQVAARYAGYGEDTWRHGCEHDLLHAYVADELGWPHSYSVWSAAHGTGAPRPMEQWSQRVKDEEHLVVSLQRYINTGLLDDYGVLDSTFGMGIKAVALEATQMLRPWLAVHGRAA